jgi:1-acyl-sn-glycerol-3-phosphate acyltransferase
MFYWVVKAVLAPILRLLFRPWAEGTDYVPRTGPAILASNHLSFSDHFFAPLPLPRKVVFLAKSEYFTGRGIKGLFSRAFFSGVGQIPVDRSGGQASERALATGLRVLASGQLLGIYPEGTRTPDGRLFRGKTGVARLALEARVPVIPCAMIGGFEFQPPGKIAPQFKVRPGVKFGQPLDFARYYGMENDRLVLRAVTDEIIYEIMKLSGQEYVDEYAAQHKVRKHAEKRALKHDAATAAPAAVADGASGSDAAAADGAVAADADGAAASAAPEVLPSTGAVNGAAVTSTDGRVAGTAGGKPAGVNSDATLTKASAALTNADGGPAAPTSATGGDAATAGDAAPTSAPTSATGGDAAPTSAKASDAATAGDAAAPTSATAGDAATAG